jgi:asparagine synthase (glutamine-hydrolysing)
VPRILHGRLYNYRELRKECKAAGEKFCSQSDTEVILGLHRRHGTECLAKLRGMFAFAIWDQPQQHLFLARDRVGKKPLNYALTDSGIIFCSGIDRALHACAFGSGIVIASPMISPRSGC